MVLSDFVLMRRQFFSSTKLNLWAGNSFSTLGTLEWGRKPDYFFKHVQLSMFECLWKWIKVLISLKKYPGFYRSTPFASHKPHWNTQDSKKWNLHFTSEVVATDTRTCFKAKKNFLLHSFVNSFVPLNQ